MDVNHLLNFSVVYSCQKEDENSKSLSGGIVSEGNLGSAFSLTMVCDHMGQLVVGDLDTAQQPISVVLKSICRKSSVGS